MRALGISAISLALTAAVISNAYYQKKQFYPSVVYITKSNSSMAVIYVQSLVFVLMFGKLMRKIFLGQLRAAEFEHLMERFWYALTETCLAFTVFRDDFNSKFVAMFTVLLFLKSFHWLAEDRVDYMERSPVIGLLFYIRVSALLLVLGSLDYFMISHAYYSTIAKGPTVQLVFGFEYAVLITLVANTTIKYILHSAEMRAESPWENKAVFLLYTELVIGFIRVVLYVLFVIIMVKIYTLPLFAFRPMYYTMRNFKKAFNDVILSRRAIRNMNTLYPDATTEELSQSDNICIICREDMISSAKKLPCGHIFHTACLRSWFQRQQTCPTCRLNILRSTPSATITAQARGVGAAGGVIQQHQPVAGIAMAAPPPPTEQQPLNDQATHRPTAPAVINEAMLQNFNNLQQSPFANFMQLPIAVNNNNIASPMGGFMPPPMPPPFPMLTPYILPPPPPMPPQLNALTDDELHALEGNERRHIEERIKLLRNVLLLTDAAVLLMNQYTMVVSRLNSASMPLVDNTSSPPAFIATESTSNANDVSNDGIQLNNYSDKKSPNPSTSKDVHQTNINNRPATNSAVMNDENFVKIEDLGSEEYTDSKLPEATPTKSSIAETSTTKSTVADTSSTKSIVAESSEAAELRRRRLQKFLKVEKQTNE